MKNTTKEEMRNLKVGDTFWINGIEHTASVAAGPCGDAEFSDEFIVYDEDDEGWLESDFEEEYQPYNKKPEPGDNWREPGDNRREPEYLEKIKKEQALLKSYQKSFSKTDPMSLALDTAILLMEAKIEEWEKEAEEQEQEKEV